MGNFSSPTRGQRPASQGESSIQSSPEIRKNNSFAEHYQEADIDTAIKYREENSVRDIVGDVLPVKPNWCTLSAHQLGKYGVGLELYFDFLKYSQILFLVIAVISIWPAGWNFQGGYLLDGETIFGFDKLTLANQKGPSVYEDSLETAKSYVDDTRKFQIQALSADILYTVIFLVFIYFYRKKSMQIVETNKEVHMVPSDFALEVKGLPKDAQEGEVHDHFSRFGEVLEVSLARNYGGKLLLYRQRSELEIKLGIAKTIAEQKQKIDSKVSTLEKKLKKFDDRLNKKNLESNIPRSQLPVNRAYIVFNHLQDKNECLQIYKKANHFFSFICKQPESLRFRGQYILKVKTPSEPSSILWENLEVSSWSRRLRRLVIAICVLVLMLASVALIYELKTINTEMPKTYECRLRKIEELSFDNAKMKYTSSDDILCWCLLEGITSIYGNSEEESYCDKFISLWEQTIATCTFISLGIIIINLILRKLLRKVSNFDRVTTVTKQQQKFMFKAFIAMFVNTTLITVVVNADFQDFVVMRYVPFKKFMFDGDYDDFTREWYLKVGSAIVMTMIISIFFPQCLNLCFHYPLKKCKICFCRRRKRAQYELNQLYLGPEYDIASKTAVVLNIIFSCFLYSGGVPVLNAICFVSLFLIYWIEKFLIVNHYRKPPVYDKGINDKLQAILPFSILLHCAFSLCMYGSDAIWPEDYTQNPNGVITAEKIEFFERIYRFPGITLIIVMIATVCLSFFSYAWIGCKNCCRSLKVSTMKSLALTYREEKERMVLRGVASYDIMANTEYRDMIISLERLTSTGGNTAQVSTHHLEP